VSITTPTGEQSRCDEEANRSGSTVEPTATPDEAALLPPKLQARLAAWYRLSGQFGQAEALLDEMTDRGPSAGLLDERWPWHSPAATRMQSAPSPTNG
jgi:hypothetical protein